MRAESHLEWEYPGDCGDLCKALHESICFVGCRESSQGDAQTITGPIAIKSRVQQDVRRSGTMTRVHFCRATPFASLA